MTRTYTLLLFSLIGCAKLSAQQTPATDTTKKIKDLTAITVVAKVSATTIEPGKIIYEAKDLPVSRAGSAGDILKFMPSVAVGGPPGVPRDIRYRGLEKAYSLVLIDGKNAGLTGNSRETILNQIPASSIERIEIMSNPGPEYDGEGVNGVINIILKRGARKDGIHGSIMASGDNLGGYATSASVNYRKNNVELYGSFDHYVMHWNDKRNMVDSQDITKRKADGSIDSYQDINGYEKRHTPNTTIKTGIRFQPTRNSSFLAEYSHGIQQEDKYKVTDTRNLKPDHSFKDRTHKIEDRHDNLNFDQLRLAYSVALSPKADLSIETNGVLNHQQGPRENKEQKLKADGSALNTTPAITHTDEINTDRNIFTQVDYKQLLSKTFTIQAGYKHSYRNREAEKWDDKYNYATQKFDRTQKGTDNFEYTENIHAAYVKGIWKYQRWNIDGGFRYENTGIKSSTTLASTGMADGQSGILLPNLNLIYNLDKTQYVKASMGRRIRRAGFKDLNPFVDESDPAKFKSGNPDLKPEKAWLWEVGYLKNFSWGNAGVNLFRRDIRDMITKNTVDFESTPGNLILFEQPINITKAYVQGMELMAGFNLFKWMDLQVNYSLFDSKVLRDSIYDGDAVKDQYDWSAKSVADFYLPTKTGIQVAWNAVGPKVSNTKRESTIQYFDAAVTQRLFNKLELFLKVTDIFESNKKEMVETTTQQYKEQWQLAVGRTFTLGASLNF